MLRFLHEAVLKRKTSCSTPRIDVELGVDGLQVLTDGSGTQKQILGDLSISETRRDQRQDLTLPATQSSESRGNGRRRRGKRSRQYRCRRSRNGLKHGFCFA